MLKHLGSGIATSPQLYIKICRIIKYIQKEEKKNEDDIEKKLDKETLVVVKKIIMKRLLPAMSYFSSKPGISENIWAIFEQFPYEERYKAYND